MNFTEKNARVIEELKAEKPIFLQLAKNNDSIDSKTNDYKHGYICPSCDNGRGESHTGIIRDINNKDIHYKCFKCGGYFDIFDLYGVQNNISNYVDKVKGVAKYFNKPLQEQETQEQAQTKPVSKDYSSFYRECIENWNKYPQGARYLQKRGISLDTAIMCNVGFCPNWRSPKGTESALLQGKQPPPESARVIFPNTKIAYTARAIDDTITGKFKKQKEGEQKAFFNQKALNTESKVVFVCEGEFDCLSIIELTGIPNAIALGSTSYTDKLIGLLKDKFTDKTFIIALDNDKAGKEATKKVIKGLQQLNINCVGADLCGGVKDINEYLQQNRAGLQREVKQILTSIEQGKPDSVQSYLENFFEQEIEDFKKSSEKKTGFFNLDEKAGGLFSGLYVLAAGSSIGKTTLSLQIADNLAQAGEEVLFFSLEQGKLELITKSLARITADINIKQAITSLAIRKGNKPAILQQALARYTNTIADKLSIIEGNFNCNVDYIAEYTRRYVQNTGKTPVVFIDYLQILQGEANSNIRETMNNAVTELRRLSRELNCTVFVISAINRANYLTPIDFESIKESGGIEYTADVVYGLQLSCLNEELFDKKENVKAKRKRIKEAKAENPRKIDLVCLKNRYGVATFNVSFDYTPQFDLYTPTISNMADFEKAFESQKKKKVL